MKLVLFIAIMFTLSLVHGVYNKRRQKSHNKRYQVNSNKRCQKSNNKSYQENYNKRPQKSHNKRYQVNNNRPCQRSNNGIAKYNKFLTNHIVQKAFNRSSKSEWEKYISDMGLCNRPKQSFLKRSDQASIKKICNGKGHQLKNKRSNLCISDSTFGVYDLKVDNNCKVTSLVESDKKVIVACDVIDNQCVPVHFEKLGNQQPDNAKVCKP